jgi:hypothetical protein
MFSNASCQICGVELSSPLQRLEGVCGDAKCRLAWAGRLQARRNAEIQRQRIERNQIAAAHRDREALRLGVFDARSVQPVAVPANLRNIVNLAERRKWAFRDFLTELISQAAAIRAKSGDPPHGETAADCAPSLPALATLLGRGCATCRGRCCNGGGTHAYLAVDTILGYMRKHPKQRPRDVLEAYLSLLPHKTYEDSCVYHAENGCVLPREMRAKISGDYFCEELHQFRKQFYAQGERKVVFYAFEGRQIERAEPLPRQMPRQFGIPEDQ